MSFSRYSVGEFRLVYTAMFALALIQQVARRTPAVLQSPGLGLEAAVIVLKKIDLVARVARCTGLPAATVTAVLDDLTYGSRQNNPDPALQPFIRLAQDDYAVSPFLWTISSPERNLCVLLNRIPEEQAIYARLKAEKDGFMRTAIVEAARRRGFRTVWGRIRGRDELG